MIKLLPLKSIKNKTLRGRGDLSLFEKNVVHRYHYEGSDDFKGWIATLSIEQRQRVKDMLRYSNTYWDEQFGLLYGRVGVDSIWTEVIKIIGEEKQKHCGVEYHIQNATIAELKKKFNITQK